MFRKDLLTVIVTFVLFEILSSKLLPSNAVNNSLLHLNNNNNNNLSNLRLNGTRSNMNGRNYSMKFMRKTQGKSVILINQEM